MAPPAGGARRRGGPPGTPRPLPGPPRRPPGDRTPGLRADLRLIAHLSDLHFGREDPAVLSALLADLAERPPDLVVVSGDLTQRARRKEFQAARRFLERLPAPWLAVPGNHDIPLFDLWRRFLSPLARYHRCIAPDENPLFLDGELAVLGLNTARSNTWKDGRLSTGQIALVRERLAPLPAGVFKVVATHHPFVPPPGDPSPPMVGRGREALLVAETSGVELLLAGHLHEGYTADVRRHVALGRSMLVAQAGTAISRRRRREPNTYNSIAVAAARVAIEVRAWDGQGFAPFTRLEYLRQGNEWKPQGEEMKKGGC